MKEATVYTDIISDEGEQKVTISIRQGGSEIVLFYDRENLQGLVSALHSAMASMGWELQVNP